MTLFVNVTDGCALVQAGGLTAAIEDLKRAGFSGGELDVATSRLLDAAAEQRLRCGVDTEDAKNFDGGTKDLLGFIPKLPLNVATISVDLQRILLIALLVAGGAVYLKRRK